MFSNYLYIILVNIITGKLNGVIVTIQTIIEIHLDEDNIFTYDTISCGVDT